MKSEKYTILPINGGPVDKPAVVLSGATFTADQAHAVTRAIAQILGKPCTLFMPGRRSPAGLYAPKP